MVRSAAGPVRTFSIAFADARFDESAHARRVARHCGTDHRELLFEPDAHALLESFSWHYDDPFADSSALPSLAVSHLARSQVTVVLNGDGGDEAFGGYDRYVLAGSTPPWRLSRRGLTRLLARLGRLLPFTDSPNKVLRYATRQLADLDGGEAGTFARWVTLFNDFDKRFLMTDDFHRLAVHRSLERLDRLFSNAPGTSFAERALWVDRHSYLPDDLLVKMDLANMAHALESRSPLLDHEFVELVARVPFALKVAGGETKSIFKRAVAQRIPAEVVYRPKQGFMIPLAEWLRGPLRGLTADTLLSQRALQRGLFRRAALERLLAEHQSGRRDHAHRLWSLLVLERWFRTWVDALATPRPD
jgi:asparagine synthase (glutamine-hydrolysing)